MEDEILEEYRDSIGTYFSNRLQYINVVVAILYWQESDLNIAGEIQRLRNVFEHEYKYHVLDDFAIPFAATAQQALGLYLASTVAQHLDQSNTLLIVYYAGHCYYTEDGQDARWFARMDSNKSLSWTSCGQCLFGAIGDVLIILDCCEAAVKLKGTKEQGRFELLAATARGVATPRPSRESFTTFLINELRKRKRSGVTARELSSRIWNLDDVTQTPHWDDFALKRLDSILLRPLNQQDVGSQEGESKGFTLFSLSHNGELTGYQLADYLKTAVPAGVTDVKIEALVLKAKELQEDKSLRAFPKGSFFYDFPEDCKAEILRQIQQLDSVMEKSSKDARRAYQPLPEENYASENFHCIERAVSAVNTAVETPLLLGRSIEELVQVFKNGVKPPKGVPDMISLRHALLKQSSKISGTALKIERDEINFIPDNKRFCQAKFREKDVLIEFSSRDFSRTCDHQNEQIEHIALLLNLKKRVEFRILPCLGFFHDNVRDRFGFVFEQHEQARFTKLPIALDELYKDPKLQLVCLDDRLQLAHSLAVAVDHFHRVGWVHKELRTDNVLMLAAPEADNMYKRPSPCAAESVVSLAGLTPWIFGFEFAREESRRSSLLSDHDAERNKFRHPDRIGQPREKFSRAHDVYALGVILFEIAQWKRIKPEKTTNRMSASSVLNYIGNPAKQTELAFRTGKALPAAIMTCLEFDVLTKGMTELDEHQYFQHHVVQRLEKATASF